MSSIGPRFEGSKDIHPTKMDDKTEKKIVKHKTPHVIHSFFHKIERAMGNLFRPKLENLEIKEKRIIREYNKKHFSKPALVKEKKRIEKNLKILNENLENKVIFDLSDSFINKTKKDKLNYEKQLAVIEKKIAEFEPKVFEAKLSKLQSKIDNIKQGVIATEKKIYTIDRNVDTMLNELNKIHMGKEFDPKLPQELDENLNKLSQQLSKIEIEIAKNGKKHPDWNAKVVLIKENIINAQKIIEECKLHTELAGLNNPDSQGSRTSNEVSNRIKIATKKLAELSEAIKPLNEKIENAREQIESNSQLLSKQLNFGDILDNISPTADIPVTFTAFSSAYVNWKKSPKAVDKIYDLLLAADNVKYRLADKKLEFYEEALLERIDRQLTSSSMETMTDLYGYAKKLDQLLEDQKKLNTLKEMTATEKTPTAEKPKGIYFIQQEVNSIAKKFKEIEARGDTNNPEALLDAIENAHEMKLRLDALDTSVLNNYPKIQEKMVNLDTALTTFYINNLNELMHQKYLLIVNMLKVLMRKRKKL